MKLVIFFCTPRRSAEVTIHAVGILITQQFLFILFFLILILQNTTLLDACKLLQFYIHQPISDKTAKSAACTAKTAI